MIRCLSVSSLVQNGRKIQKPSVTVFRKLHNQRLVLGIESTFDDSAAAVVNEDGLILGEAIRSQMEDHAGTGGVKPHVASKLHKQNIPIVVEEAMQTAGINFKDLSALATATRPGFAGSLLEGLHYSKEIVKTHGIPFIPVHHMEAHALTVRMTDSVDFPFLVLLTSGGHCLMCLAERLGEYKILGQALDEPPGAVFDKIAREMNVVSSKQYRNLSGGRLLEMLAMGGNSEKMPFTIPLSKGINRRTKSCNFSFSGLQSQTLRKIDTLRKENAFDEQGCKDLAAGFQMALVQHIVNQFYRGIVFCKRKNLLPDHFTAVLSGGVAANKFLRESVHELCREMNGELVMPPQRLCTDNGIMIAWTGMEYLKQEKGIVEDMDLVDIEPRSPMGEYIGDAIIKENIPPKTKENQKQKGLANTR